MRFLTGTGRLAGISDNLFRYRVTAPFLLKDIFYVKCSTLFVVFVGLWSVLYYFFYKFLLVVHYNILLNSLAEGHVC